MDFSSLDLKQTVNLPSNRLPHEGQPRHRRAQDARTVGARAALRADSRAPPGPSAVHAARRPALRQRPHSPGHAFNKILKDFIVKSKTMAGFDSPYVPGWDCHGLPIEIKVDAPARREEGRHERRRHPRRLPQIRREVCRPAEPLLQAPGRLRPLGRSLSHHEPAIPGRDRRRLRRFPRTGATSTRASSRCTGASTDRTALAEAEVEYENHTSPSIWVRFELATDPAAIHPALAGREVYGLIWTTTPWTIPANMAIAFHPKYEYAAVEVGGAVYIVAADLVEATAAKMRLAERARVGAISTVRSWSAPSSATRSWSATRSAFWPITSPWSRAPAPSTPLPATARKTTSSACSTASRSTARWTPRGRFFHATGAAGTLPEILIGKTVWEANPIVIEILREHGALLAEKKSTTPIRTAGAATTRPSSAPPSSGSSAWTATISASRPWRPSRTSRWMPAWGEERISNMIATRPDWCISRQRVWGVPIIVFYCDKCREAAHRPQESGRHRGSCSPSTPPTSGTSAPRPNCWAPRRSAPNAAAGNSARKTTFSTCGSIPAPATWPC